MAEINKFMWGNSKGGQHYEFGVNEKTGELYYNKKKIVTEQKLTLNRWVNIAIVLGAVSTVVLAILDCFRYFNT